MGKLTKVQEVAIAMASMASMAGQMWDRMSSRRESFGPSRMDNPMSRRSPEKRRKQRKAAKAGRKAARK